jgi:predicted NAD-dependent protein-ADP-ribosyltransferase YbiA (DUF1768 family)
MERASYFIKDRAIFGSFPTQETVNELELKGVRVFINLTHCHEKKITPYCTKYKSISYPIDDHHVPKDWEGFACFILKVSDIIQSLKTGELIYIHCKGGHGRAGVVVASLFCYIFEMSPNEALEKTTKFHSERSVMRDKWRKLGSPQTFYQKNFVHKFFKPLIFHRVYEKHGTDGFSNFTEHSVYIPDMGLFSSSEKAIQAYKNLEEYAEVREEVMYKVVKAKFDQHLELRNNLLKTGLRPIIYNVKGDYFWGNGGNNSGVNKLGKILMRIREEYYRQKLTN